MDVRFDDPASFETSAALFAAGGAVLGAVGSLPIAAAGSALSLLLLRWRGRRVVAACASAAVALAGAATASALRGAGEIGAAPGAAAATGAMLGLLLGVDRADLAKETGTPPPSASAVALGGAFAALAVALASTLLPALADALRGFAPRFVASAAAGGSLGLWAALCAMPLHVRIGGDPLEKRLAAIRFSLDPALRALAERAVAARSSALRELPEDVAPELPASLDALAAAALELAARASGLSRAASPQAEQDLQRRSLSLVQSAEASDDEAARGSYLRAADALGAHLEHLQRVRRARERALAQLHEDVANLERARFSLTLLHGPQLDAELALLQDRLRDGAAAFEEAEVLRAPSRARA